MTIEKFVIVLTIAVAVAIYLETDEWDEQERGMEWFI